MAKKSATPKGKSETIPDETGFTGIQLESKQIVTLILMLKGSEGSIVKNAVEALYKYADKSNENKIDLYKKNSVPLLFNLLLKNTNEGHEIFGESDFNMIKRYSAMTIGILSSILNVRKLIKKSPDWIKALIQILVISQDGSPSDQVIVEFICLTFSNISMEFTGKVVLANVEDDKSKLPQALVNLLPHTDPDIIYNSAQTLNNLAQDFENLAIIRNQENLEDFLLNLLDSCYPAIQKTALSLLENISREESSASKFGDLQGVTKLISILGDEKLQDLHELSLQVLSNCFKISDLLAEARNQGALLKLLQMSGRESSKNSNESGALAPPIMAALANAFENIAVDRTNADILVDEKIDVTMLKYLNFEDKDVNAAAARAVATLSKNVFFKESFAEKGIQALTKLLEGNHKDCIEASLLALSILMMNCTANIQLLMQNNGIALIIRQLKRLENDIVLNGLAAMRSMSLYAPARLAALDKGLTSEVLGDIFKNFPSTTVRISCANTLSNYLTSNVARSSFRSKLSNVKNLLNLLESDSPDLREAGARAVKAFASEAKSAQELAANKALALLQEAAIKQPNSLPIQQAFEKLLDYHLSVKFAILGRLSAVDRIEDGFYDTGSKFIKGGSGQQDGTIFPGIEELAKLDVSHVRPVIYVNSGESRSQQESSKEKEPTKRHPSSAKKNDKNAKKTKGKGKSHNSSKDETQESIDSNNESMIVKEVLPNPLDDDKNLARIYLEIGKKISYKHSMEEQCKIIANQVSSQMGGSVTYETIDHIEYQVHLSEQKLKYKSNVIPIGDIHLGTFTHRALLFKAIADKIGLPVSLVRGNYNRAWNEIVLPFNGVHKNFIIDLMINVGELYIEDCRVGERYKRL